MNKLRIKNWFIIERALIGTHLAPLTQKCPLHYGFTIKKRKKSSFIWIQGTKFPHYVYFLHIGSSQDLKDNNAAGKCHIGILKELELYTHKPN